MIDEKELAVIKDRAKKPWLLLNDSVRMALTVKTPQKAKEVVESILKNLLLNGRTNLKIKSRLTDEIHSNVLIQGYNFKQGSLQLTDDISSVIGVEVIVKVDPELGKSMDGEGDDAKHYHL